ncbi:unnamed protein product [Dovyalis caffra]|uniref:Uncharacterized protein n=1 Tax=Dovyalis caffra TaxID=77055 RepID=A0AAV1RB54_9ROSI|nr:unnamed protein product [Dovyalis caffra]
MVLGSPPSFALSQVGRNIEKQIIGNQFFYFEGLHRETHEVQSKELVEKTSENMHKFEEKERHVPFQEIASVDESSLSMK